MKQFRTTLDIKPSGAPMNLTDGILTQGSCFSDAIGQRLASNKIRAMVNPFGVIYNPESIHKVLSYSIFNEPLPQHTFLKHGEIYLNYNFHSALSSLREEDLAARLTNTIGSAHYFLKDADWVLITYGTAWVYRREDTGEVVANCHKLPSAMFSRSIMTPESIGKSFLDFYEQLKKFNAKAKVILTISPVRHLKDTLELNSVSKAVLRVACHDIASRHDDVEYFPAYEILMDDLRDYRFYKSDMLHPTTDAEDYIWEKFMERYFSADLKDFIMRWQVIVSALRHKPFHPQSSGHQQFLRDTLKKLLELQTLVDVGAEITVLKNQIAITEQR